MSDPTEWKLVWADEFNDNGPPNPANWTFERGLVRNHEAQWYQPENATCRDGHLVIEARREHVQNAEYTSASLMTKGLRQWQSRPLRTSRANRYATGSLAGVVDARRRRRVA